MNKSTLITLLIVLCFGIGCSFCKAQTAAEVSRKGWSELEKDNDSIALRYFVQAYEIAKKEKNYEQGGLALLRMGICYYPVSYSMGLHYAMLAMNEFKNLERSQPQLALAGRSKCLQLVSTINSRQGKYKEAIALSKEAAEGFHPDDSTDYIGLIYNSLGVCYGRLGLKDSSAYYHRLALRERLKRKDFLYLPTSLLAIGDIMLDQSVAQQSLEYYRMALHIADSTANHQAQASAYMALGRWHHRFGNSRDTTENYYHMADNIAIRLTDKSFGIAAMYQLMDLEKERGNYRQALQYSDKIKAITDTLHNWEKNKAIQILEVQFDVAEKSRQLALAHREVATHKLVGSLIGTVLAVLLISAFVIIGFLKRINRRDKQLLKSKEDLISAIEEQKRLKEQQMQQELEYKESQLSAITLQMVQRNELLQELKEKLDSNKDITQNQNLHRIIDQGLEGAQEWTDFNSHFESINKNFYLRLKKAYPDISPNDLRICALIKMNLSIKEMAVILNISPDSVKTARYRLRKKLQLNTEDNLTDFILSL